MPLGYSGAGVRIASIDRGINEQDLGLQNNYDANSDYNLQTNQENGFSSYIHGNLAAQIIAGNNTGIAHNATITSFNAYDQTSWIFKENKWQGYEGWDANWAKLLNLTVEKNIDVAQIGVQDYPNANGSFYVGNLQDPVWNDTAAAYQNVVNNGRNGLGTVLTMGSGNSRAEGMDTNISGVHNNRFQINVSAADLNGNVHELSTGGASILVAAQTQNIEGFQANSQSSAIAAGVAALILEANPNLGYRDVQEILAYSAENSLQASSVNGAINWNGGGLLVNNDLGFGLIDSETALRLAETWQYTSIGANSLADGRQEQLHSYTDDFDHWYILQNRAMTDSITVEKGLDIDWVEVNINLVHENSGDLRVVLISPDGTESLLINRPLVNEENPNGATDYYGQSTWALTSTHHWGENGIGDWKLKVEDVGGSSKPAWFSGWTLNLYGDELTSDNIYYYTNEYAKVGDLADRDNLSDHNGGIDTINASGIYLDERRVNAENINCTINLNEGQTSLIAGKELIISGTIENAFTGDGDDLIYSNSANNFINGGRGNNTVSYEYSQESVNANLSQNSSIGHGQDSFANIQNLIGGAFDDSLTGDAQNNILQGKAGDDFLSGEAGNDVLIGGSGNDHLAGGIGDDKYIIKLNDGQDIIEDLGGHDKVDLSDLVGKVKGLKQIGENFEIGSNSWARSQQNLNIDLENGNSLTIKNFFSPDGAIENISLQEDLKVGTYRVSESGEIKVNFLMDGGSYKSSLGIFSLVGLENLEFGSAEFIQAAAARINSNSELGHIVLNDALEGALYNKTLGGGSGYNQGQYLGEKSFQMVAGSEVALMLLPNSSFDNILNPSFSIPASSGQVLDRFAEFTTTTGYLFAIEDAGDRDYNDLVVNIQGLEGQENTALPANNSIDWLETNYWHQTEAQFNIIDG